MLQATLDGVTAAFYNAFFTSLPIGGFALLDRPLRRFTTLEEHPEAYNRKPPLTAGAFWKTGVATAVIHALVRLIQRAFLLAFYVTTILHCIGLCKCRVTRGFLCQTGGAIWKPGIVMAVIHTLVVAQAELSLAFQALCLQGMPDHGRCMEDLHCYGGQPCLGECVDRVHFCAPYTLGVFMGCLPAKPGMLHCIARCIAPLYCWSRVSSPEPGA